MLRAAEAGNVTAIAYLIARIDPEFHKLGQDGTSMGVDGSGFDSSGGVLFYIPENGREWEKAIEGEAGKEA